MTSQAVRLSSEERIHTQLKEPIIHKNELQGNQASIHIINKGITVELEENEMKEVELLVDPPELSPNSIKVQPIFKYLFFDATTTISQRKYEFERMGLQEVLNYYFFAVNSGIFIQKEILGETLVLFWILEKKPKHHFHKLLNSSYINIEHVQHSLGLFSYKKQKEAFDLKSQRLQEAKKDKEKYGYEFANTKWDLRVRAKIMKLYEHELDIHLTGGYTRVIINWLRTISANDLYRYALKIFKCKRNKPSKYLRIWKDTITRLHSNPKIFVLDWFQHHIIDHQKNYETSEAAINNLLESITSDSFCHNLSFSWLPKLPKCKILSEKTISSMKQFALKKNSIETILKCYDRLLTDEDSIQSVLTRLRSESDLKIDYFVLLQVLRTFPSNDDTDKELRAHLLNIADTFRPSLPKYYERTSIAIYADSEKCECILGSTIASLLVEFAKTTDLFINGHFYSKLNIPKSATEILEFKSKSNSKSTDYLTTFISTYYEKKQQIDSFVVVLEPNELSNANVNSFMQLYYKYYHEVYPATLIVISKMKPKFCDTLGSWKVAPYFINLAPTESSIQKLPHYERLNEVFGVAVSNEVSPKTGQICTTPPPIYDAIRFHFSGDESQDNLSIGEMFRFLEWREKLSAYHIRCSLVILNVKNFVVTHCSNQSDPGYIVTRNKLSIKFRNADEFKKTLTFLTKQILTFKQKHTPSINSSQNEGPNDNGGSDNDSGNGNGNGNGNENKENVQKNQDKKNEGVNNQSTSKKNQSDKDDKENGDNDDNDDDKNDGRKKELIGEHLLPSIKFNELIYRDKREQDASFLNLNHNNNTFSFEVRNLSHQVSHYVNDKNIEVLSNGNEFTISYSGSDVISSTILFNAKLHSQEFGFTSLHLRTAHEIEPDDAHHCKTDSFEIHLNGNSQFEFQINSVNNLVNRSANSDGKNENPKKRKWSSDEGDNVPEKKYIKQLDIMPSNNNNNNNNENNSEIDYDSKFKFFSAPNHLCGDNQNNNNNNNRIIDAKELPDDIIEIGYILDSETVDDYDEKESEKYIVRMDTSLCLGVGLHRGSNYDENENENK